MSHNLFDDFKTTGYHSSVISTFSLDPAFYDTSLQVRMRSQGCINNTLLVDSAMLDQAIEMLPDAFQHAGRKYLLVPVRSPGCFHPKLALRYGKQKARLIIGSANATSVGWAANLELVSALSWNEREESPDNEAFRTLISRAHFWLWDQVITANDENLSYKLELIKSQSPWLEQELEFGSTPIPLDDGSSVDLLFSTPGGDEGLSDRMQALIDEPIERLTVISPYWDADLSSLKRIVQNIPDVHIMLALNGAATSRVSTFPVAQLDGVEVNFHPVSDEQINTNRFLHAKLFLFQGNLHDYLFLGSANCTKAALGVPGRSGINHEALLFRKLPAGAAEKKLRLSYQTMIDPTVIKAPRDELERTQPTTFAGGIVARSHSSLTWTPPPSLPDQPTEIVVGDAEYPLLKQSEGLWRAGIGGAALTSNIARIRLMNGRMSRPVVISNREELMRFAPFPVADSIRRKLNAVVSGESDLINLAKDIHLLLSDDQPSTKARERLKRASVRNPRATIAGRDFDTPEDFRKALETHSNIKFAGLQHSDNPALQALLQIVLRGMASFEQADEIDALDTAKANSLDQGEDQDDEGLSDESSINDTSQRRAELSNTQHVSRSDFERNQAALERGIEQFHTFLDAAKSSDQDLDIDFVTRALFMLYLMLYGCSKEYEIDGEGPGVLIPFGHQPEVLIYETFVFRAAQAISKIWGPDFARSLVRRVRWNEDLGAHPVQIKSLTIITHWVLAAILGEVRANQAYKSLRGILEVQVPKLIESTRVFPDLDQDETAAMISQMEENMRMATEVRQRIRKTLGELQKMQGS